VSLQNLEGICRQRVPDDSVVVVVAGKEEFARLRKGDRGDSTQNPIRSVLVDLAVRANIEETARRVVGSSSEGISVWEHLDTVDIGFVVLESLDGGVGVGAVVPELGGCVARTRYEARSLLEDRNTHDISTVIVKNVLLGNRKT